VITEELKEGCSIIEETGRNFFKDQVCSACQGENKDNEIVSIHSRRERAKEINLEKCFLK